MHPCYCLFPPLLIQSICKFPSLHLLRASLISHFPPLPHISPLPHPCPHQTMIFCYLDSGNRPNCLPVLFPSPSINNLFSALQLQPESFKKLELGRFSLSLKTLKGLAMFLRIKPPIPSMALGGLCDLAFPVSPVSFSVTLLCLY